MGHVHFLLDKIGLDKRGLDKMALNQNDSQWRATARAQRRRERNPKWVTHSLQLQIMTDKGTLLTDGTDYAR